MNGAVPFWGLASTAGSHASPVQISAEWCSLADTILSSLQSRLSFVVAGASHEFCAKQARAALCSADLCCCSVAGVSAASATDHSGAAARQAAAPRSLPGQAHDGCWVPFGAQKQVRYCIEQLEAAAGLSGQGVRSLSCTDTSMCACTAALLLCYIMSSYC